MAYTEFYCIQTGNNLNAGSSPYASADFSYAGGTWDGTSTFTVGSGDPATDTNGNTSATGVAVGAFASIYTTSGATVAVYVARVASVTGTTIVLSTTAFSGTVGTPSTTSGATTCKVGGAWGGPSSGNIAPAFTFPAATMTDPNGDVPRINIQGGTNWATTAVITRSTAGPVHFEGYTTSPGDGGGCVVQGASSGTSYNLINTTGHGNSYSYITATRNGSSGGADGFSGTGRSIYYRCRATGLRTNGFSNTTSVYIECGADTCNGQATTGVAGFNGGSSSAVILVRCVSHDHSSGTCHGFLLGTSSTLFRCIADRCSGSGFYTDGTGPIAIVNCDAYNCSVDGIQQASATNPVIYAESTNAVSNTDYGSGTSAASLLMWLNKCGQYGNGTAFLDSTTSVTANQIGILAYGSSPYTSVAATGTPHAGNFQVTAASGAMAAGLGFFLQNSTNYSSTTTAYPDLGVGQAIDTSSRGGRQPKLAKMGG